MKTRTPVATLRGWLTSKLVIDEAGGLYALFGANEPWPDRPAAIVWAFTNAPSGDPPATIPATIPPEVCWFLATHPNADLEIEGNGVVASRGDAIIRSTVQPGPMRPGSSISPAAAAARWWTGEYIVVRIDPRLLTGLLRAFREPVDVYIPTSAAHTEGDPIIIAGTNEEDQIGGAISPMYATDRGVVARPTPAPESFAPFLRP